MSELNPQTAESIGIPEIEVEVTVDHEVQWPVDKTLTIPDQAADAKETGDAIADLAADVADLAGNVTDTLYPVGTILMTTSTTAPIDEGTWEEIVVPMTWGDAKNGTRSYSAGTGTGTIHFWMRTA